MLLSNESFLKMAVDLGSVYDSTIKGIPLFLSTFDPKFLVKHSGDLFKKLTLEELD